MGGPRVLWGREAQVTRAAAANGGGGAGRERRGRLREALASCVHAAVAGRPERRRGASARVAVQPWAGTRRRAAR